MKNPSQTLSPRPCRPMRLKPSFQSPQPISGKPLWPVVRPRSRRGNNVRRAMPRSPAGVGRRYDFLLPVGEWRRRDERQLVHRASRRRPSSARTRP